MTVTGPYPRKLDTGLCDFGKGSRCRVEAVFVGDRGSLSEVGMAAAGVVAV